MKNKHMGSNFDDLLQEDGLLAEAEAVAVKRVLSFQLEQAMKSENLTKSALAKSMKTSRSALDRLLDPTNISVTLQTLEKAAVAVGGSIRVEFVKSANASGNRSNRRCRLAAV